MALYIVARNFYLKEMVFELVPETSVAGVLLELELELELLLLLLEQLLFFEQSGDANILYKNQQIKPSVENTDDR